MNTKTTRRSFLGTTVPVALAGRHVLAQTDSGTTGANDAIVFGVIGCGGRGHQLVDNFKPLKGVRFAAVCDVHKGHMAQMEKHIGGQVQTYSDYRKLLDDKSINAVIVATNGHWHALPAIDACAAGKDVYVEKPLATSIGEGRAVVKAARKHNRIVMIGTQQHNWEHYRKAVEIIRSGKLGDISHVHVWDLENHHPGFGNPKDCDPPAELDWDFWVGPSPKAAYNPNRYAYHYWFYDYGGAWQLDWAVHHYDIVQWAMGVNAPIAAYGMGGHYAFKNELRQWPDTFNGSCEYPAGPLAKNGFIMSYAFRAGNARPIDGRTHGKAFYGMDATLILDRSGYHIYSEVQGGKKVMEDVHVGGSRENHAQVFLDCVRSRKQPESDIEVGHYATNPGHLMNISYRLGRRLIWDPKAEQFVDDAQANAMVTKEYRKPWSLPA